MMIEMRERERGGSELNRTTIGKRERERGEWSEFN